MKKFTLKKKNNEKLFKTSVQKFMTLFYELKIKMFYRLNLTFTIKS